MTYDITFLGHMCFDEIQPYQGEMEYRPGSAILCGGMAAANVGKKVAVLAKMAEADAHAMTPLIEAGANVFVLPAAESTRNRLVHPSPNVDERTMVLQACAGFISLDELPDIKTTHLHLAGISDQEFTFDLITALKDKGHDLSVDMQSFVRQVDPVTSEIFYRDVPLKQEITALMSKIKLDIVEAQLLTGQEDLEAAAKMIESWGCPEVIITESRGVLARAFGKTHFEEFSNTSIAGRTGRGDTTFAGYMARRMDHEPAESLKFAAAVASLKMETPGPFTGTYDDVIARMNAKHL